jgi:UDP-2-acetamido-2-deoxy-ribo-hexuluronate aminotransferase
MTMAEVKKAIQMVDLATQYASIKDEIDQAILGVVASSAYINGPEVKSFGEELEAYLGVKHVIPCANGTDALQIAMMALDLKPGDEVIAPSFTFVATAEVIALLGLTPVVVDVDPVTFNVDPACLEAAITPKTKAIVPVHLFGQSADMDPILEIAKRHNLYVIEDTAQAIGADYASKSGTQKVGTFGDFGTTSFFPSKNLGCFGDGGALFTNDDELAEKARQIANHGMKVRYYHDMIGVNSRLDSIQAAVLRIKLRKLNEYNRARNEVANYYDQAFGSLPQLSTPGRQSGSSHVFHQYTLKTHDIDRDGLRAYLESEGIPAMIYYPVPLHLQKAYQDPRYNKGDFPHTESLSASVISLPIHTEMTTEQLETITGAVKKFVQNHA